LPSSGDDGGFSISFAPLGDPYLRGRRTLTVTATVPAGDAVEQVDFFVDGKLVFIDLDSPYSCAFDFGDTITRHTLLAAP